MLIRNCDRKRSGLEPDYNNQPRSSRKKNYSVLLKPHLMESSDEKQSNINQDIDNDLLSILSQSHNQTPFQLNDGDRSEINGDCEISKIREGNNNDITTLTQYEDIFQKSVIDPIQYAKSHEYKLDDNMKQDFLKHQANEVMYELIEDGNQSSSKILNYSQLNQVAIEYREGRPLTNTFHTPQIKNEVSISPKNKSAETGMKLPSFSPFKNKDSAIKSEQTSSKVSPNQINKERTSSRKKILSDNDFQAIKTPSFVASNILKKVSNFKNSPKKQSHQTQIKGSIRSARSISKTTTTPKSSIKLKNNPVLTEPTISKADSESDLKSMQSKDLTDTKTPNSSQPLVGNKPVYNISLNFNFDVKVNVVNGTNKPEVKIPLDIDYMLSSRNPDQEKMANAKQPIATKVDQALSDRFKKISSSKKPANRKIIEVSNIEMFSSGYNSSSPQNITSKFFRERSAENAKHNNLTKGSNTENKVLKSMIDQKKKAQQVSSFQTKKSDVLSKTNSSATYAQNDFKNLLTVASTISSPKAVTTTKALFPFENKPSKQISSFISNKSNTTTNKAYTSTSIKRSFNSTVLETKKETNPAKKTSFVYAPLKTGVLPTQTRKK